MGYKIIQTSYLKRSLKDFLRHISSEDKKDFIRLQWFFDNNSFDRNLWTYDIYKDLQRNVVIYSSYITNKIRLI